MPKKNKSRLLTHAEALFLRKLRYKHRRIQELSEEVRLFKAGGQNIKAKEAENATRVLTDEIVSLLGQACEDGMNNPAEIPIIESLEKIYLKKTATV